LHILHWPCTQGVQSSGLSSQSYWHFCLSHAVLQTLWEVSGLLLAFSGMFTVGWCVLLASKLHFPHWTRTQGLQSSGISLQSYWHFCWSHSVLQKLWVVSGLLLAFSGIFTAGWCVLLAAKLHFPHWTITHGVHKSFSWQSYKHLCFNQSAEQ